MQDDYYQILGVSRTANDSEIQKAYRKLARKYHPDLHEDPEKAKAQFQKVQNAYDVLSDPEKRRMYDQFGADFQNRGGPNPFEGFRGAGGEGPYGSFEFDLNDLGNLFGGGRRGRGGRAAGPGFEEILRQMGAQGGEPPPSGRGQDVLQEITVPFAVAILGGRHQINLEHGDGSRRGITITIPAGIEDGKKIRLRGQGGRPDPRFGGEPGDLLIKVHIADHPHYTRRGRDLLVKLPITLGEAALGAKIDLPTPHGTVSVTVPPASSSGKVLRLRGLGIKPAQAPAGDLLVELKITLPEYVSDEDRALIEQLQQRWHAQQPRRNLSW